MRRWFLIGKVHRVVFLLVLSPGLFSNPSLTAQTTAGQAHFLKGKQLIEDNCIDCMRGTQAGMEQGIQEMNQAIEAGYPGKKAAYKFLLDAFKHMQTYTERDPKQSEMFRQKELDLIRKLYELYPRDPEILQAYAYTVKDEDKQIEVLRKILSLDTKHPGTRFELGILLIKKKNLAEGISLLREGVRDEQNPESM